MLAFKRRVSKYFTKRNLLLRKLNRKSITAEDDYAELYVLMRIVQLARNGAPCLTTDYKGKRYYTVATSPSPKWSTASHFLLNGQRGNYALRTGLEVKVSDGGTVELDVVLIDPSNINNDIADGMKLGGSLEVKNHTRKLSSTIADHVRGKASRLYIPLPVRDAGDNLTSRYCLVSRNWLSENAICSIASAKIDYCKFDQTLDYYLTRLVQLLLG